MANSAKTRLIVKVQLPISSNVPDPLPLVYAKGHRAMKHQPIGTATLAALGRDLKGYFEAEWIDGRWLIGDRVAAEDW